MPYTITWEPKGVYWKYSGAVTGDEIIEASTAIYGDPRFDDLRYKLVDFSDATNVEINETQVDIIAHQHGAAALSNPHVKNAIVNTSQSALIDRFIANLSDSPWEARFFTELDEANKWLNR